MHGDRVLLEQVLFNLVMNGLQAMQHTLHRAACGGDRDRGAKTACCVRVADRGPGIGPEIAPQLFEPFFTTKAEGPGARD